jgi:hypothetical protein
VKSVLSVVILLLLRLRPSRLQVQIIRFGCKVGVKREKARDGRGAVTKIECEN